MKNGPGKLNSISVMETNPRYYTLAFISCSLIFLSLVYSFLNHERVELGVWQSNAKYSVWSSASYPNSVPIPLTPLYQSKDSTALSYETKMSTSNKIKTLHALAKAKAIASRLNKPDSDSGPLKLQDANAFLAGLSNGAQSSDKSSALVNAQKRIAMIMAQSAADRQLGQSVLKSMKSTNNGIGNTWNALVSRQIGPHSLAVASDWLATAQATSPTKQGKSMLVRAQLAAALAETGGRFVSPVAIRRAVRHLPMGGPSSSSARHEYFAPTLQQSSNRAMPWTANSRTPWSTTLPSNGGTEGSAYGYVGNSVGSGGYGGGNKDSNSGAAPGLSSYDAEILAHGPPT